MRTTKPISTVWFGSDNFLRFKLDDLIKRNELDFYCYIKHLPEGEDKKEHRHLFCVPSHRIDTQALSDHLTEFDPLNPKPIIPLPWRSSKFDDWFLYNSHDTSYLASKGQERKYHYSKDDFECSDKDYFNELLHEIDYSKVRTVERVKELIASGKSFDQIVALGVIPIQQIRQYQLFYEIVSRQLYENFELKTRAKGKGNEDTPDDVPF